jgi:hypothetical protein
VPGVDVTGPAEFEAERGAVDRPLRTEEELAYHRTFRAPPARRAAGGGAQPLRTGLNG